jgi:hypothetical protein
MTRLAGGNILRMNKVNVILSQSRTFNEFWLEVNQVENWHSNTFV